MYNNIGLPTPRGSGTSGYIQRNLSYVRPPNPTMTTSKVIPSSIPGKNPNSNDNTVDKNKKTPSSFSFSRPAPTKKKNRDLELHQSRRAIELKLLVLSDDLKEKGFKPNEVERKVNSERQKLTVEMHAKNAIQDRQTREEAFKALRQSSTAQSQTNGKPAADEEPERLTKAQMSQGLSRPTKEKKRRRDSYDSDRDHRKRKRDREDREDREDRGDRGDRDEDDRRREDRKRLKR